MSNCNYLLRIQWTHPHHHYHHHQYHQQHHYQQSYHHDHHNHYHHHHHQHHHHHIIIIIIISPGCSGPSIDLQCRIVAYSQSLHFIIVITIINNSNNKISTKTIIFITLPHVLDVKADSAPIDTNNH